MPTNLVHDFTINGLGFMLARDPQSRGRAWQRTGVSDSLSTQRRVVRSIYSSDEEYGGLPDELDHPEVHDDWSGGCGDYYHHKGRENHYHAGFNVDTRFPGMWFHAQAPNLLPHFAVGGGLAYASLNQRADFFLDVPLPTDTPPVGAGAVMVVADTFVAALTPTPYQTGQSAPLNVQSYASAFDYDLAPDPTEHMGGRPAVFGSFVYIGSVTGSGFLQAAFKPTLGLALAVMPARWFTVAASRLWRGHGRGYVQSCAFGADPTVTANWSATLTLGNGQMASQDAISLEDRIFVGMPDGLYMGDQTGTFSNVATQIGANVQPDNCRDLAIHNGQVVFAEGGQVWGYKPGSGGGVLRNLWPQMDVRPLAATLGAAPVTPGPLVTRGVVRCLESFGRWLYAGAFNGSQSMVYCGQEASGPDLPYVWHPMQLLAGPSGETHVTKISRLHVDAITAASNGAAIPRRIWAATDASFGAQTGCTAPLYFWPIPLDDGPPFMDSSFSAHYCPQAVLEEAQHDWDAPGTWKVWRKLESYIESMPSSQGSPLTVAMILDGTMQAPLANFGQLFATVGPPKDYSYFTNANSTAIGQAGRLTYLSTVSTASVGTTPIYRAFVERGNVRPRTADVITAKVHIGDAVEDRQGGVMRPGANMLNDLRQFALSSNPFPLVDLMGTVLPILVIPPIEEQEAYQGGSDNPDVWATVKMAVLDASWPTAIQTPINPRGG